VIHAVGPQWGEGAEELKLRSAVRASLDHAARLEVSSLAMPAISTGIFGYPKEEGTRVIVEEASSWLAAHPGHGFQRLRFTAFDAPTANLFARAVSSKQ
jgi:O-acetyl-ADP-ribose deacetylase (regulator of RNase III)